MYRYDFLDKKCYSMNEELKISIQIVWLHLLDKCIAYKRDNKQCKNSSKTNFCGVHVKYPNKIIKIITKYISINIAKKCVDLVF